VYGDSVLSQLAIPTPPPVQNYAGNPEQINNYNASVAAANANPGQLESVGLGGGPQGALSAQAQGSPPGTNTSDPNDLAGNPDVLSGIPTATGDTPFARLENLLNQVLQEALAGKWHRRGTPGNPNILQCYQKSVGVQEAQRLGAGDATAWCAAFAGTMLQGAGVAALQTLQADAYRSQWSAKTGATALSLTQPNTWRRNDVCVINGAGGHHVAFIRGADPSSGRVNLIGGNQGSDVTQINFLNTFGSITYIGRHWTVPAEFDKPILGNLQNGSIVKTR